MSSLETTSSEVEGVEESWMIWRLEESSRSEEEDLEELMTTSFRLDENDEDGIEREEESRAWD